MAAFGGHRTVPVVRTPEGNRLTDSLSIGWHLAQAHPEKQLLPANPHHRTLALNMISEMHSGFVALRSACPMNLATAWDGFAPDAAIRADLDRIDVLWASALNASGGPFLFGDYGLADAYYAPVAMRIAGYGLQMSETAEAYVQAQLAHPAICKWRREGLARDTELSNYDMQLNRIPFPMS